MKGIQTVCLLCRHARAATTGAQNRLPFALPWHIRGQWFSDTATSTSNEDPNFSEKAASPQLMKATEAPREHSNHNVSTQKFDSISQSHVPKPKSKPKSRPTRQKAPADDVDVLFQEIVSGDTGRLGGNALGEQGGQSKLDLGLIQNIAHLEDMVDKGLSLTDSYAYLKGNIYPTIQRPGAHVPQIFHRVALKLMNQVAAAKKQDVVRPDLPTVAEICRVYADIAHFTPTLWASMVGELVIKLVTLSPRTDDYHSIEEYEQYLASRSSMLNDLVESWKILSLPKHLAVTPDSSCDEIHDGFWLPHMSQVSVVRWLAKSPSITSYMTKIFPHYHGNQLGPPAAVLALASYALFLDPTRSNDNVQRNAARFIRSMDYYIANARVADLNLTELLSNLRHECPPLQQYILNECPKLKSQARARLGSNGTYSLGDSSRGSSPATAPHDTKNIKGQHLGNLLSQVYGTRNFAEAERLWFEFIGSKDGFISETRAAELKEHAELFNSFIRIFMALNSFDKAITAMNTLHRVGLKPTLKTWNVMLDGCKKARNLTAIQNIWAKITAARIKLDKEIWTTRVSGLIEAGGVQVGIAALEEMVSLWKRAGRDKSKAVQPTIEPINAALVSLVRGERVASAEKLLVWAGRQGIEPDIFTFNTLLRPLVRSRRHDEVKRLLSTMQSCNVKADAATFSVMLDAAFSAERPPNEEATFNLVGRVLSEMEAIGLEANLHTYGKMIYLLLQSGDRSKDAVKAVLAHLWARGHELSPHIYTMLVEHYFSRVPPDLAAVDSLLKRRKLYDSHDLDRVFYDRVIKGFASVGDTTKALELYYKLSGMGYMIILGTQVVLLNALLHQRKFPEAQKIVLNTKRMYEDQHIRQRDPSLPPYRHDNDNFWRHNFWHIATSYGLWAQEVQTKGAESQSQPQPQSEPATATATDGETAEK